jgi:ribosomal protein S18 acetylase RimI-like enzyme
MISSTVRRLQPDDDRFLLEMFLETFFWREDLPRLSLDEVLAEPSLAKYIAGWGRPGDAGVVAESDSGERLGAAWYRLFSATDHGYGFVSGDVPEVGIAVRQGYRGRGLGHSLMEGLIELAREAGLPGLSLSVEDGNSRAAHLYESYGFVRVERVQTAWTMVLMLEEPRT